MTSLTLRTLLLILILFMARLAHPSHDTCERMEIGAQPGGIVQDWQNSITTCVEESKADWGQICQQKINRSYNW